MQEKRLDYYSEGVGKEHVGLSLLEHKPPMRVDLDLRDLKGGTSTLVCLKISLPGGEVRKTRTIGQAKSQLLRAEELDNFIRVEFDDLPEGGAQQHDDAILLEFLVRGIVFHGGEVFHFIGCSQSQLKER